MANRRLSRGVFKETTIASATTCDIGASTTRKVAISGSVTITSLGTRAGAELFVRFTGAPLLTYNATSLILPGGGNIQAAAGDTCIATSDDAGNWCIWNYQSGQQMAAIQPQGRLTLTTAVPYLASDVTAAGTIYYTPAVGVLVPIYDGTKFVRTTFAELSQALSDTTKSPAAAANSSNYDLFIWNDAGTIRCTRGPAWSSGTSRGTGAGTTELERVQGLWLNKVAITNGPAANRGTYVGTIRTNGSATVDFMVLPAAASGGAANLLGVWNAFNRMVVVSVNRDSDNTWDYTTATLRAMNGSASNGISFVVGLGEGSFRARAKQIARNTNTGCDIYAGIGLDSTSANASGVLTGIQKTGAVAIPIGMEASLYRMHSIGFHTVTPLEYSAAVGTTTWYGDGGGSTIIQAGMILELEM